MPIYKITSPQHFVGLKLRGREESPPSGRPLPDDRNGNEGHVDYPDYPTRVLEKETARLDDNSEAARLNDAKKLSGRKETIIEREIREQLEREAELASLHGIVSKTSSISIVSSAEPIQRTEELHPKAVCANEPCNRKEEEKTPKIVVVEKKPVVLMPSTVNTSLPTTTTFSTSTTITLNPVRKKETHRGGGELILHELMEQKDRETEWKRRWKERGCNHGALEDEHNSEPETKDFGKDVVDSEYHHQVEDGKHLRNGFPGVETREEGDKKPAAEAQWNSHEEFSNESSRNPEGRQRHPLKVRPFEDVELIQSEVHIHYLPQNETPIEREIRLGLEREEALRMSRGIISIVAGQSSEEDVDVQPVKMRLIEDGVQSTSSLGITMKKFAESRLRSELEREKKREIDLLKEGKIKLLSEQRAADAVKYVGTVSSETEELREFTKRKTLEKAAFKDSEPAIDRRNGQAEELKELKTELGSTHPLVANNPIAETRSEATDRRSGNKLVRASSKSPNAYNAEELRRMMITAAEQRIEEEIAESKQRELELREQHKMFNSGVYVEIQDGQAEVDDAHAQDDDEREDRASSLPEADADPIRDMRRAQPEVVGPSSPEGVDDLDSGRREPRRLALIEQWERGIIQRGGISA